MQVELLFVIPNMTVKVLFYVEGLFLESDYLSVAAYICLHHHLC